MRDQGVQNLQEAFRYVPGVVADPFGFDSRGDSAIVRGINAPYFADGLQTTYGFNSSTAMIEPTGFRDNLAFVGILSTQVWHETFVNGSAGNPGIALASLNARLRRSEPPTAAAHP
jgi:hypothetical protein